MDSFIQSFYYNINESFYILRTFFTWVSFHFFRSADFNYVPVFELLRCFVYKNETLQAYGVFVLPWAILDEPHWWGNVTHITGSFYYCEVSLYCYLLYLIDILWKHNSFHLKTIISATIIRFQHDTVMPKSTINNTGDIFNRKLSLICFTHHIVILYTLFCYVIY